MRKPTEALCLWPFMVFHETEILSDSHIASEPKIPSPSQKVGPTTFELLLIKNRTCFYFEKTSIRSYPLLAFGRIRSADDG